MASVAFHLWDTTDVGYTHMNLDDCWSEKNRSASGDLLARVDYYSNAAKLGYMATQGGLPANSILVHSRMKRGMWIGLFPFDSIIKQGIVGKYSRMANAIADLAKTSGKPPILFSLCEWGRERPWLWARRFGQSWRTTEDIGPQWDVLASIINQNSFITWASDFYGHNDMDILEVGNGALTFDEAKSHFTAWALMKSPLLISTELSTVTSQTLEILKNTEIIAINQDRAVGTSISPFRWGINPDWTSNSSFPAQYWSGESQNGTVFMLVRTLFNISGPLFTIQIQLNTLNEPADMFFNLTESPWIRAGRQYSVRDLWTHTDNGTAVRNFTAHQVPPHGVVALLLKDAGDEPAGLWPPCARFEWCMDQNGTRLDNIGF
ncbi:hypothetical protein H0H92_012972 [Tricholoma furcatifolium]|nr:hypothetical protein H0H92_012972 [Tricholoma furcatifolium]